jgi:hypothetical protein
MTSRFQTLLTLTFATCAGLVACATPVVRSSGDVEVRAADAETAERILAEATRLRVEVLAELESLPSVSPGGASDRRPIVIEHGAFADTDGWHAGIAGGAHRDERWIRVPRLVSVNAARPGPLSCNDETTLAHELVHVCLGADWEVVPNAVEEGLADLFSARIVQAVPWLRAMRGEPLVHALGGLRVTVTWSLPGANFQPLTVSSVLEYELNDVADVRGAPGPEQMMSDPEAFTLEGADEDLDPLRYAVAYLLVDRLAQRIGLVALRQLCAETCAESGEDADDMEPRTLRVVMRRLFEQAGEEQPLRADFHTIAGWLAETWDAETQRALLAARAEELAPYLAEGIRWPDPVHVPSAPEDIEARRAELEGWNVQLAVSWEGPSAPEVTPVRLSDVPELFARLQVMPLRK